MLNILLTMKYGTKNKLSARSKKFLFLVIEMFTEIYNKIIVFLKREKLFLKWHLYSIDYILPLAQDFVVAVCLFEMKITTILLVNLRFCFEYLTRSETYFDITQLIKPFYKGAFWEPKIILQQSIYTRLCTKIKFYLVFDITNFTFFRVKL